MSFIYLQMPIAPDTPIYSFDDLKARYLELTGEEIEDNPQQNEQGTHYLIGSWRLTQDIADQIVSEFPPVTITNSWPAGWVSKES